MADHMEVPRKDDDTLEDLGLSTPPADTCPLTDFSVADTPTCHASTVHAAGISELRQEVADWKARAALEVEAKEQRDKWQTEAQKARQMVDIATREIDDLKTQVADLRAGHDAIRAELDTAGITEGSTVERIKQLVASKATTAPAIEIPDDLHHSAALTITYLVRWFDMATPAERQTELPAIMRVITNRWDLRGAHWHGVVLRVNGRLSGRPAIGA